MTVVSPLLLGLLTDLLSGLGLGASLVVAVVLLVVAWEGYRMISVGKRAGGVLTNVVWYGVVVAGALGVVIALGWARPDVGSFVADVTTWGGQALDWVLGAAQGVLAS